MASDRQQAGDQPKAASGAISHDQGRSNVDQLSSMMAHEAAQGALADNDISAEHAAYARRYASEAAARTMAGENAVDLDSFIRENDVPGFKGDNYPTYDIASRTEVASVKTHWSVKGELNASAIAAYKRNFSKMRGWGRSPGALEADGERIIAVHEAGSPIPEELNSATAEETSNYLQKEAILRIPDDHVEPVRRELEKDIHTFPSNYQLPENPSSKQVEQVLDRIQGIGLTSGELQKLIDERMSSYGK